MELAGWWTIMASRRAPIQSQNFRPSARNTHIYLAMQLFYTSRWLMSGGACGRSGSGPGRWRFRQFVIESLKSRELDATPILAVTDFALTTYFC
jgi:hypothetical protein